MGFLGYVLADSLPRSSACVVDGEDTPAGVHPPLPNFCEDQTPMPATLLDLDQLAAAKAEAEPFPFLIVSKFLRPEVIPSVITDCPAVSEPRNHAIATHPHGPVFDQLLEELAAPELSHLLGEKLGVEGVEGLESLESLPQNVTVRTMSEASDGNVHRDHWSKCVTLLIYPNVGWDADGGRLRFLRSMDLDDYAAEIVPAYGTMLAFRRNARSFHGHKPHVGMRRVVQVSWLRPHGFARLAQDWTRRLTHARKRLGLHPDH